MSFVIMGATGHVGGAAARHLLAQGHAVTAIAHDLSKADGLKAQGATVIEADVEDVDSLRKAFQQGKRAFLLNPPADPSQDIDAVEKRTIAKIIEALNGSALEKVVAASTYGAQKAERIGDLGTLWGLEEGLRSQPIPAAINRGAYYMHNWDALIEPARETGTLPTMLPADRVLPMIAPDDLGRAAAERLITGLDDTHLRFVEGPERYSPNDVAAILSRLLGRDVKVEVTPKAQWREAYRKLGFSDEAADSYARMTEVSVEGGFEMPDDPWKGTVTLEAYLTEAVKRSAKD